MNLQTVFNHIEPTDSIKQKIEQKSNKLKKYFDGKIDVKWTCSVDKEGHHSHVTVSGNGFTINADSRMDDLYKTLDDVIQKVEKQLAKQKGKIVERIHHKHAPKRGEEE